ncbi:hypothetical protein KFK09_022779 [Dendrobium nobile]|uniref:Integrase catalytic domain-containing protein n=1 Tax=Dendrobium nobile TaxID=94219 RepID=A0A8T3AKW3_DENNO|nr:hypothetical protein KFK09_022779 [Dendrobium nobile]
MASQESSSPVPATSSLSATMAEISIPSSLKFLMSNLKHIVSTSLTNENYPIWRLQVFKLFSANGFEGYLTGTVIQPVASESNAADLRLWKLVDQNLVSALLSTISAPVLPYILSLSTAHEIWLTLENRLQPTNRSRVIQLKNELHHVQMKELTMTQYLAQIKAIVDNIAASGGHVDVEDVILHTLNGLPSIYNPFKSAIRTTQQPVSLDTLYSLLCSEEINLQIEQQKEVPPPSDHTALWTVRSNTTRGRFSSRSRGRGAPFRTSSPGLISPHPQNYNNNRLPTPAAARPTCQICGKLGHVALNCWHRCNMQYAPTTSTGNPRAFLTNSNSNLNAPVTEWVLDSSASSHLTSDATHLQHSTPYSGSDTVSVASGSTLPIHHTGQGLLPLPDTNRKLHLQNLLHVPLLSHNLLSIHKLTSDNNCSILFDAHGFLIKDLSDNSILLRGCSRDGLYPVQTTYCSSPQALHSTVSSCEPWHARLGHPNIRILQFLSSVVPTICTPPSSFICTSCNVAKSHKLPFNSSTSNVLQPFQLIHSDVWGPAPVSSFNGFRYYILFIDDHTRYTWLYLMHSKDESFSKFQHFHQLIKNSFNKSIQTIRTDGGGEYTSHLFRTYLNKHGITHQFSCPYTPEQNGLAERKHRHLLEMTRALLHTAHLPQIFWAEALLTSTYLINILPTKACRLQIPFQQLHGSFEDLWLSMLPVASTPFQR